MAKCECGCGHWVTSVGLYYSRDCMVINEQPEPIKRTRGRPRKWKDDAERMRAKRAQK